jgi:hypothetical protein
MVEVATPLLVVPVGGFTPLQPGLEVKVITVPSATGLDPQSVTVAVRSDVWPTGKDDGSAVTVIESARPTLRVIVSWVELMQPLAVVEVKVTV